MHWILRAAAVVDRISWFFGAIASVLVLASCLISAGNATSRYLFHVSSNAWLEIQWQMFAGIFLLGAPWVLKVNEHVRVDMLYSIYSARGKLWVDVIGFALFFFPAVILMIYLGYPWAMRSVAQLEMSNSPGGLAVWPVKLLLPLGFFLLLLQGLAEFARRIAALMGVAKIDIHYEKPLQ